jgi:hypothetical protein
MVGVMSCSTTTPRRGVLAVLHNRRDVLLGIPSRKKSAAIMLHKMEAGGCRQRARSRSPRRQERLLGAAAAV